MMRPHCDRCDKLCDDPHTTWVEDNTSPLDHRGQPMVGSGTNPIWHITIGKDENMFCRTCRLAILEAHVASLKQGNEVSYTAYARVDPSS